MATANVHPDASSSQPTPSAGPVDRGLLIELIRVTDFAGDLKGLAGAIVGLAQAIRDEVGHHSSAVAGLFRVAVIAEDRVLELSETLEEILERARGDDGEVLAEPRPEPAIVRDLVAELREELNLLAGLVASLKGGEPEPT